MEAIVTRIIMEKASANQLDEHAASSAVQLGSTCARCGGLMVNDFCMDVLNSLGESKFAAKRCVQCGEVVDLVILQNRGAQQEPMTSQQAEKMVPNNRETRLGSSPYLGGAAPHGVSR